MITENGNNPIKEVAQETYEELIAERFVGADGSIQRLDKARYGKVKLYPANNPIDIMAHSMHETPCKVTVVNTDSFKEARNLAKLGNTAVLNFASAYFPGGGWLKGANAQEEALCRSSTLFMSIGSSDAEAMYKHNKCIKTPYYSDYMLYSPTVLVYKNSLFGDVMSAPFECGVITAAAVNVTRAVNTDVYEQSIGDKEMMHRICKIFDIAIVNNVKNLVLGAWGCGVFGNEPETIASYFKKALEDGYKHYFDNVSFAVLDKRADTPLYTAFSKVLLS